jgi:hypothetical protein
MISRRFPRTVIALFCLGLFVAPQGAQGQTQVPKLKIGTLGAPSTSVWMVSVLVAKRFDLKNGIDIEWVEQPTTAAVYNDFAAGSYRVATGGVISYANQYARGVKSKLFATLKKVRVSIPAANVTYLPFYPAKTEAIYKDEAIDVEFILMPAALSSTAAITGDIDYNGAVIGVVAAAV